MTRLAQWDPPGMTDHGGLKYNDIWGYVDGSGNEYAIIGTPDSIVIIDVTNCGSPQRVYAYYGGPNTTWRDFKTYDDHLYAVCDICSEGLHIFDLSNLPTSVSHELTTTAFFNRAHNIFIDTSSALLYAVGTNTADEGMVILDLSADPANPSLEMNVHLDQENNDPGNNYYIHDVYVRNDTAYASHGFLGYYVWDMTDLNNIELLGDYDSPGYNHSSWTHPDKTLAYYAEEVPRGRPMAVIDLENLGSPIDDINVIHTFKDPLGTANDVTPHNPFIKDDTLYISYYEDGIKMYDLIANDTFPSLIGYYDTYPDNGNTYTGYEGAWGTYPFLPSGCILVSDISYGLNTLNYIPPCSEVEYFQDFDADGFGNAAVDTMSCSILSGYVTNNLDCDDTDPSINPAMAELCDGLDNDCNSLIDDNCTPFDCDGDTLNIPLIVDEIYRAKSLITSNGELPSDENSSFYSGIDILLNPGFGVTLGASFLAIIADCDETGILFRDRPYDPPKSNKKPSEINEGSKK